ncbi:P-loop containing nucleoside triphosphate hydrolase protein [Xylaria sp. FL0064]|nr:P-loop containing nucleoside triphosphate hydrolase protein [Xylaria sp. FL0064]
MSTPSGLDDSTEVQPVMTTSKPPSRCQTPTEPATLPCFIYPVSRTLRFFERTDELIQIDRLLSSGYQDAHRPFRSLALYGAGGMGKSTIALRYAKARIYLKELDAMFWIAGEKEVTIRQSFTDIAVQLRLPTVQSTDHDQNRTLVLDWLQNTECKWLLVFDNIESIDLLKRYWPTASQGRAIITTRNPDFASRSADAKLEITGWGAEIDSQFLFHLLSRDVGNCYHLRDASVTTERHKEKMPVEHARPLSKLSKALARDSSRGEESARLREESTRLLLSRAPLATDFDDEKTFDDFVFIWWR